MTAPDYPTFNRRGFRMYQGQNGLAPSFTYRGGRYRTRGPLLKRNLPLRGTTTKREPVTDEVAGNLRCWWPGF